MSKITLQYLSPQESTLLSNLFIDKYMPKANGEFVKVYIYLLRSLGSAMASFDLEEMADRLFCTEKDILRALKYWEKENLVLLNYGPDKKLAHLAVQNPVTAGTAGAESAAGIGRKNLPTQADAMMQGSLQTQADRMTDTTQNPLQTPAAQMAATAQDSALVQSAVTASAPQPKPAAKPTLTPDRVKELKKNDEVVQLLYIAEQYLGKTLTPTEMQKILFFYDELHMSADLVDYLIEHCVGRGHKSIRYIETVAMAWAKEGITTVKDAKESSSRFGKDYYTILKAMGITNRNPVDTEVTLMDTWMKDYGFTMDLILEACNRTVLQTGQPSFQYTDKILSGWKKKQVKGLDDIRVLDAEHKKRKLEKAAQKPQQTPKAPNRFNNFHQREYDFDEYEKRLLNQ